MRRIVAIAAGLILSAQSFSVAQDPSADEVKVPQATRSELDLLRAEIRALKETCGIKTVNRCATVSKMSRQFILRRYVWVPASSVMGQQALVSGLTTSGTATFQTPLFAQQNQLTFAPTSFADVQTSPLLTNHFAVSGFSTGVSNTYTSGPIAVQSFAPTVSTILPASPYAAHPSYDFYSNGPAAQSMSAGFSTSPLYPTATFRGTCGFVNTVPAPYYSAD